MKIRSPLCLILKEQRCFCDVLVGNADLFMHGKKWLLWNSILQLLWCVLSVVANPAIELECLPLHSPNQVMYVLKRRSFFNAGHEWRIFTYQLDGRRFCNSGFGVTKITYRGSNAHATWLSIIMVNFGLQHTKHKAGTVEKQNFCFGYGPSPPPAWWWMAPVSFGTKVPQKRDIIWKSDLIIIA